MSRNADVASAVDRIRSRVRRTASPGVEERHGSALAGALQLARDYAVVVACPKFRASERARIRGSVRSAMVVVIVAASLNCLWLIPFHPDRAALLVVLNLAPALIAACAYAAAATRARRHPEALAFAVLASIDLALVALGQAGSELDIVAWGYILLMPMIVAAVIPWSTRYHAGWLGLHASSVIAYAILVPNGLLGGPGRQDAFALFLVAITVSLVVNLNRLQGRVLSFIQIQQTARSIVRVAAIRSASIASIRSSSIPRERMHSPGWGTD